MSEILLRSVRRLTSLEGELDVETLVAAEFRAFNHLKGEMEIDRELSVYAIALGQVTQTLSECFVSAMDRPGRDTFGGTSLDLTGVPGAVEETPGETAFLFTKSTHRIIKVTDEEVREVARIVHRQRGSREHPVHEGNLRTYVKGRLDAEDPEWTACLGSKPNNKWKNWALGGSKSA